MLDPNRFYKVVNSGPWNGTIVYIDSNSGRADTEHVTILKGSYPGAIEEGKVAFRTDELELCDDYDYPDEPLPEEILNSHG